MVLKAADAAARWHVHQRRKGAAKEPYINHLLEVATLVAEATDGEDSNLVVAALLHDAIEDCEVPHTLIADAFGTDVADLVAIRLATRPLKTFDNGNPDHVKWGLEADFAGPGDYARIAGTTIGELTDWFKKRPADAPPADVKKVHPDLIWLLRTGVVERAQRAD